MFLGSFSVAVHISPMLVRARKKLLVHPTQRVPFDYDQWQADYKNYSDGSIADRSLCDGAAWLASHFSKVYATRDYYKLDRNDFLSKKDLVQMHIASANLFYVLLADERQRELSTETGSTLENMLDYKTSLVGSGSKLHPNQVAMFNLDSLCSPLFEILNETVTVESILYPQSESVEWLDRFSFFRSEVRCSQLYYNGVIIWQQLLYGDSLFAYDLQHKKIVISQLSELNRIRVVSEYRREHHQGTTVFDISSAIELPLLGVSSAYPLYILTLSAGSDLKLLAVSECNEPMLRFLRYKKAEPYLGIEPHLFGLMGTKVESADGATSYSVRDILRVWFDLSALAFQIYSQSSIVQPENWEQLASYCQWFIREDLVNRLVETTGMSVVNISAILELLTFRGSDRQDDLWAKPIVAVEGSVAFAISALLAANMRRNVDIWIQAVDKKSHLRGTHFEESLEMTMRECQVSNSIIGAQLKWALSSMLKYGKRKEEVDLTFNFGNTIVVVEARSRRTPITPLDYHNAMHEESGGMLAKATQAERKANYVRENLAEFCAQFYPHLLNDLDKAVVHPLVLVNDQFHAGFPIGQTPVLDESLLKHFLKDGRARFMGSHQDFFDHRYAVVYYENLAEAEAAFFAYALNPTIVAVHKMSMRASSNLFDPLGTGAPPVQWLSYEIQEPKESQHLELLKSLNPGKLIVNY